MRRITQDGSPAFQGDVMFRRVEALPKEAVRQETPKGGVVAHSETGHHHVATGDFAFYAMPGDVMRSFLVAKGPIDITHHRPTDTHEALELLYDSDGAGEVIWEIGRQREYVPEGWRRVED